MVVTYYIELFWKEADRRNTILITFLLLVAQVKKKLSSQSQNGDDQKKHCEASTAPEDVSAEGLKYPDCLVILVNNLKNLETQINNVSSRNLERQREVGLTHFQPMFDLCWNQVVGFY